MKKIILSLFICCIYSLSYGATYYSKPSATGHSATETGIWYPNAACTGTVTATPTSFTGGNTWIVQTSGLNSGSWSITGTLYVNNGGSFIINGGTTISAGAIVNSGGSLTVNSSNSFTANSISINSGGSLTLNNGSSLIASGTTLTLYSAITVGSGTSVSCTSLVINSGGSINQTGGTISVSALTTINSGGSITYGTGGTVNATNSINNNGSLTVNSGTTLNMGTYALGSSTGSFTNNGTISSANTGITPIPLGMTWGGTVIFNSSTAYQRIPNGTYNNLTINNTSGANCTTAGNITTNTLTLGAGANLLSNNLLSVVTPVINSSATLIINNTTSTPITAGKTWGGTVKYGTIASMSQTVVSGNYNNLIITSGGTANGDIAVSNSLNVTGYFYLGANDLTGSFSLSSFTGTIGTQSTSNTPLPSGKNWTGGTIMYHNAAGGQKIMDGTYGNLFLYHTSGTSTSAGDVTVNGTLKIPYSAHWDLGTYKLAGTFTSLYGFGTIHTKNTSSTPFSSGRSINLAVYYENPTGGQTVIGCFYNKLVIDCGSGTNVLTGPATANALLIITSGIFNIGSNTVTCNGTLGGSGTVIGSGKIDMYAPTISLNSNGIVLVDGGPTVSNVTLNNNPANNGHYYIKNGDFTVTGTLNLNGISVNLNDNNLLLPVGASITGSFSGSNMIMTGGTGMVKKYMNGTGSYTFPIGDSVSNYTPISVTLTGGSFTPGSSYIGANVVNSKSANNLSSTNYLNRYWNLSTGSISSPVYNITNASYVVGDVQGTESSISTGVYSGSLPWSVLSAADAGSHYLIGNNISATNTSITGMSGVAPTVSVTPLIDTICNGGNTTLTVASSSGDAPLTYSWAPSLVVTGTSYNVSPSSTQIYTVTITDGNGQTATATATVNVENIPNVGSISDAGPNCPGHQDTAFNLTADAGGIWSSSNTLLATIDPSTGVFDVLGSGTVDISYTIANKCGSFSSVFTDTFIDPTPITGTLTVCEGLTTALSSTPSGLTWVSSNTNVATVNSSGVVTGVLAGTSIITYTSGAGCYVNVVVTVNSIPTATFTSSPGGNTCELTNVTYTTQIGQSSYVWSVPGTLGVDYSIISGGIGGASNTVTLQWLSTGSKTVTVNYNNASGCTSVANASSVTTVNARPTATYSASPASPVCSSTNETYTTTVGQSSYVWTVPGTQGVDYSISSGGIGGASNTVTLQWLTSGSKTVTVNYTNASGCNSLSDATNTITVNLRPSASFTTIPASSNCVSSDVTYTTQSGQSSYVWNVPGTLGIDYSITSGGIGGSSNTVTLKWLTAGSKTVTVNYNNASSCNSVSAATNTTTINALPTITYTSIPGVNACLSFDITYTTQAGQSNYIWSIPGTNGVDYLISAGGTTSDNSVTLEYLTTGSKTLSINYSNSHGCTALAATSNTTSVNVLPASITGSTPVCTGVTRTLTDATSGGTWSVNNTTLATINSSSGVYTALAAGNPVYTYTLPTGCYQTFTNQLRQTPVAITIIGPTTICAGSTTSLADATVGGSWITANSSIATVSSGNVTGVANGTVVITYSLATCVATQSITVNSSSIASITGTNTVCAGFTTLLADATPSGTWSSNNTAIATIASDGTVTGVSGGTVKITYTAGSCYALSNYTVNAVAAITGSNIVCTSNNNTQLSETTTGGTWSSSNTAYATVTNTGLVAGISAGVPNISYTKSGCYAFIPVTVNANPIGGISGPNSVCVGGSFTVTNTYPAGTWTTSNTSIATIGASTGVITSVSPGSFIAYYTVGVCYSYRGLNIGSILPAITGSTTVCTANTTTLANATSGGSWSSASTSKATVNSSTGVVSGVAAGTSTITYTRYGCTATQSETVYASPAAISGTNNVCISGTATYTDATSSGTWSVSDATHASVGSSTGIVSGLIAGNDTITYTVTATGCYSTLTFNVSSCGPRFGIGNNGSEINSSKVCIYTLYPNPTNGIINIEQSFNSGDIANIRVFNYMGAMVYTDKLKFVNGKGTIDFADMANGLYLIEISENAENVQTFKVVFEK